MQLLAGGDLGDEGEEGGQLPPNVIQVTPEEKAAIDRVREYMKILTFFSSLLLVSIDISPLRLTSLVTKTRIWLLATASRDNSKKEMVRKLKSCKKF